MKEVTSQRLSIAYLWDFRIMPISTQILLYQIHPRSTTETSSEHDSISRDCAARSSVMIISSSPPMARRVSVSAIQFVVTQKAELVTVLANLSNT